MSAKKLLWVGAIGTAIAALCCFTPVLVFVFAFLGLSTWVLFADLVLLPLLALFLLITLAAALRVWATR